MDDLDVIKTLDTAWHKLSALYGKVPLAELRPVLNSLSQMAARVCSKAMLDINCYQQITIDEYLSGGADE